MHPKIDYPGVLEPVVDDLARPVYASCLRNPDRLCRSEREADVSKGYTLDCKAFQNERHLAVLLDDWRRFMKIAMQTTATDDGYRIHARRIAPETAPADAFEAHRIRVEPQGTTLEAADLDGLRRAFYYLQDEMRIRRAPVLPLGDQTRWTTLAARIVRSPIAPYRWLSGWELDDSNDYYPEAYLARLARAGINGLWVSGLLRLLVPSRTIPELGPPAHRLHKLKAIVAKAQRYGIRIYFFCMEPRALPADHPAALAHPEILGARNALCASEPRVLEYVREAMRTLFVEVPDLAGIINIFSGERPTTCWWNEKYVAQCPRCAHRPRAEMLSKTLNACMEGIRDASPTADLLAWTYMMDSVRETSPIAPLIEVMTKTDPRVTWLGNFEHGAFKTLCGKRTQLHEYSLSCIGPSEPFVDLAQAARASGRRIYAKLQIGTTYELSSVPYIPVPGIVEAKLRRARKHGASGSMLTWIPGGFPGPMLGMAGLATFEPHASPTETLHRLAAIDWGETAAHKVVEAWNHFAESWQRYPFCNEVLYWGPITRGPAYLLHLEREDRLAKPYNFGLTRKREPQPWEDHLSRWTGPFTPEEVIASFRDMATGWQRGIDALEAALAIAAPEYELNRQVALARAIQLHLRSAANVYTFYAVRDRLLETEGAGHRDLLNRMREVACDDLLIAETMRDCLKVEPWLGFMPEIFDFSYTPCRLAEKIFQTRELVATLERWMRNGIEPDVLNRTVEESERLRPDRVPDRWGD